MYCTSSHDLLELTKNVSIVSGSVDLLELMQDVSQVTGSEELLELKIKRQSCYWVEERLDMHTN